MQYGRLGIEAAQQMARILETIPGHTVARHPSDRDRAARPDRACPAPAGPRRGAATISRAEEHVAVGGQDPVARGAPDAGVLGEELHELQAGVLLVPGVPGAAHDPRAVPPRQPLAQAIDQRRPPFGRVPLDEREAVRHAGFGQSGVIERRDDQHALVEVLAAVVVVAAAEDDLQLAQRRRRGDRTAGAQAAQPRRAEHAIVQQRRSRLRGPAGTAGRADAARAAATCVEVGEDGEAGTVLRAGPRRAPAPRSMPGTPRRG